MQDSALAVIPWHIKTGSRNLVLVSLMFVLTVVCRSAVATDAEQHALPNTELLYLKAIHERGAEIHPTMTPLLMAMFINAGRQVEGIAFFERIRPLLPTANATLVLTAQAVLRASNANEVFLLKRKGWIDDTVVMFNEARAAQPDNLLIRWLIGTTLAQLPSFIGQEEQAREDLEWVLARVNEIPRDGLLPGSQREVFFQLARLHDGAGNEAESQRFLAQSGYATFERQSIVRSQFAADLDTGLTMSVPTIVEVVPDQVFAARGFEMMDFHFVVSADRSELISIDAGTRPESARRAHEALLRAHPDLPMISTVLVTHAHWDHIGGHEYFRGINPQVKFISRDNYHEQTDTIADTEPAFKFFFSKHYSRDSVTTYQPDETISERSTRVIGGTTFELIPIPGGETADGLFVYVPSAKTTFVGDFIMPFMGAPFANEGNPIGLLRSIDILGALDSERELHGHTPLTTQFSPAAMLVKFKPMLEELIAHTQRSRRAGMSRQQIQQTNFIPEAIMANANMQTPYFVIRDGIISRVYEQSTGYWQDNLDGMDSLTHRDIGTVLSNYLDISEPQMALAVQRLMADGRHEAALKLVDWGRAVYAESVELEALRVSALIGLREKHQFTNPFKFLIYSEEAGIATPQLGTAN